MGDDRVTVIYALDFSEEVDRVVGKVFMDIFAATKTAGAPPCNFMEKPPQELAAFGVTENQGCLGYISFAVLPRHVKDNQREKVIHVLQTFRSFLQYHLKMSKSYWHSKMRARCVSLQKVLNRPRWRTPTTSRRRPLPPARPSGAECGGVPTGDEARWMELFAGPFGQWRDGIVSHGGLVGDVRPR